MAWRGAFFVLLHAVSSAALFQMGFRSLRRHALAAAQLADFQACKQALAQVVQLLVDQLRGFGTLGPQLAGQAAAQLRLYLQWSQRVEVERQVDAPQDFLLFLAAVRTGLLALQLDLQGHYVLLVAHRQLQLPGRQ